MMTINCTKSLIARRNYYIREGTFYLTPHDIKNIAVWYQRGRWNRETWQDGTRSNSTIEQRGPWAE